VFALFAFPGLCLVSVLLFFKYVLCPVFSSVYQREWHCLIVPLRIYSLTDLHWQFSLQLILWSRDCMQCVISVDISASVSSKWFVYYRMIHFTICSIISCWQVRSRAITNLNKFYWLERISVQLDSVCLGELTALLDRLAVYRVCWLSFPVPRWHSTLLELGICPSNSYCQTPGFTLVLYYAARPC